MDMDDVTDDVKQKPLWQFEVKEREGYRHRMAKCVISKNMYQYLRCGKRSIYDKVSVRCSAPKWIRANWKREANSKSR